MTSYDWSGILDALGSAGRREERRPNNREVKRYLLTKGLPEAIASSMSMNELCYWTEKELDEVFHDLHASTDEISNGLRTFRIQGDSNDAGAMVKPSLEEVSQSAEVLGALCVNRDGQFRVNPGEGYVALSHVWAQGLGADDDNRGLHGNLLDQVFTKLEPQGIKWIWTDSLAIPGGKRALSLIEEELKATLINAMADIYRKASQVIILDALCLRLDSVDPVKTAVSLCCGQWMTRVWTYQEIKLATNATIATKAGFVNFRDIVQSLKQNAQDEVGDDYAIDASGKFPSLCKTLLRLQRDDAIGVSLPDIAIGCGYRSAWDPLDYARSIYPTLGIEWHLDYTLEDAMEKIYESQKRHASRLALFHGPPRASFPGWAPSRFSGLVDCKIISPGTWKKRGMARSWLTSKIRRIVPSKPGALVLELENGTDKGALTVGFVSNETQDQSPRSVEEFKEAVNNGTAYLLSDESLTPRRRFSRVGLLVERFTRSPSLEAWVCFTLAVGETQETYMAERLDWLLLHENPVSDRFMSGKGSSEINFTLEYNPHPAVVGQAGQTPLHDAVQSGDIATINSMIPEIDINQIDSRGWTPLHCAAASGNTAALRLLIVQGACLGESTNSGDTPLVLAIERGYVDVVCELAKAGADMNQFGPHGASPLTAAVRRGDIEMTRLLLTLNTDPSLPDGYGLTPLISAIFADKNLANLDRQNELLDALLEAGANPRGSSPLTALETVARQGNAAAARKLLAAGADANDEQTAFPPLYHALEARNPETVAALIEGGAKVQGVRYGKAGWTPMMCAARAGDINIGRLLLKKGATLDDIGGDKGWTALHIAAAHGSDLFVKWLTTEAKAKTDVRDFNGRLASEIKKGDK